VNKITVPVNDCKELQDVVIDLQKRYQAIVDDKQRWRNFAVLSSATLLIAHNGGHLSNQGAINKATELLNLIEQGEQ
jgi:hypothetical protein